MLGLDLVSWYGVLALIAGAYLLWTAVFETGHRQVRWILRRLGLVAAERPPDPEVVLGHPGGQVILTPASELAPGEKRKLVEARPEYLIENKDPLVGIRDVTTGVRTRDGRTHVFDAFHSGLIAAGSSAPVTRVGSIPAEWLEGLHESDPFTKFLYWARFARQGVEWEVVYDPRTRRNAYTLR